MARRLAIALAVMVSIAVVYVLVGRDVFTFSTIKCCACAIRSYVFAHYWQSVLAFCAAYFACVLLLISTAPLALLAGYIFGMPGAVYVFVGGMIGAPCAFLLSRYVLGDWIQKHFARYLKTFNDEVDEHGGWYLLIIRLVPVIPFVVVNALAGLTSISLRMFMISTAVGIIAPTIVFVYAGTKLAQLSSVWDVFSWPMVSVLLGLLTVTLIALHYKRAQAAKLKKQ